MGITFLMTVNPGNWKIMVCSFSCRIWRTIVSRERLTLRRGPRKAAYTRFISIFGLIETSVHASQMASIPMMSRMHTSGQTYHPFNSGDGLRSNCMLQPLSTPTLNINNIDIDMRSGNTLKNRACFLRAVRKH